MTFKETAKWLGFGAFGCVVLVAVVYAIFFYTHDDDGLLRVCRAPNGWGTYKKECSEICWSHRPPLRVYAKDVSGVRDAARWWNNEVGFELFKVTANDVTADVRIDDELPAAEARIDAGGTTSHMLGSDGCALSSMIHVFNVPDVSASDAVLKHELGHAAGLADDLKDFGSVMHQPPGAYAQGSDVDALKRLHSAK